MAWCVGLHTEPGTTTVTTMQVHTLSGGTWRQPVAAAGIWACMWHPLLLPRGAGMRRHTSTSTHRCAKQEVDTDQGKAPRAKCCIHCRAQDERVDHACPCQPLQQHWRASNEDGRVYSRSCCPARVCRASLLQQCLQRWQFCSSTPAAASAAAASVLLKCWPVR